ncbi:MAG: hypothetical protein EP298_11030 [Gammaproteobacteria bacterium]|nr:MAG: hypothetical protein EP298_11030 [Gammaproteobacteria bacterium]UTW43520.1 hypothetical protein KFE69_05360 [bacterium SCSIO 12844]
MKLYYPSDDLYNNLVKKVYNFKNNIKNLQYFENIDLLLQELEIFINTPIKTLIDEHEENKQKVSAPDLKMASLSGGMRTQIDFICKNNKKAKVHQITTELFNILDGIKEKFTSDYNLYFAAKSNKGSLEQQSSELNSDNMTTKSEFQSFNSYNSNSIFYLNGVSKTNLLKKPHKDFSS